MSGMASSGGGGAYYNEIDPFAAAWLRELIKAGHIAPGIVDERDIRDITPDELAGFTQCHFFAGIGVWSHALRRAGWPDDRPIWTGSCPCQPFSQSGDRKGFDDERHLWPAFHWLIAQRRPVIVLGEQVAGKDADPWFDLVQSDLEGMDYAFGCVPFAAAGFGAPNIRERAYWMADAAGERHQWTGLAWRRRDGLADSRSVGGLAHANDAGLEGRTRAAERSDKLLAGQICVAGRLGDADSESERRELREEGAAPSCNAGEAQGCVGQRLRTIDGGAVETGHGYPLHTNGFWRDAEWLLCRDPNGPRWRPVEPGTFPMADGAPQNVGLIRGSGNAINAEAATGFIEAVMEVLAA